MSRPLRALALSVLLLAGGGALFSAATERLEAFTTESARRLAVQRHPVVVPDVLLQTQSGQEVDFSTWRGRWVLATFMYTRCPTVCVALGDEFGQLQRRLGPQVEAGKVELVSISFDPAHDTPEALAAYLERAHADAASWTAARPVDAEGLAQLVNRFGLTVIPDGMGGFTHNAGIHVIDPQGRLVEIVGLGESDRAARTVLQALGS